VSLFFV